jgi:uncharacterized membrane protein YraQ (UPF0718 family)
MSWFNFNFPAFCQALLAILLEGIPFLLLGSLISGLVDVFVSSERIAKMIPKSPVGSVFLGGLMGLLFPICECGSVVVVRRFVKKGLPLSCAVAYMLAAPIVSPIVAISTYKAFGARAEAMHPAVFTAFRLGLGYAVAVLVALLIQKLPQRLVLQPGMLAPEPTPRKGSRTGLRISEPAPEGDLPSLDFATVIGNASPGRKLVLAIQSASSDFLDVAFYFVIGSSLAALFAGINETVFAPSEHWPFLSILMLMGLAALLCLCSTTDAFVAANSFRSFSIEANLAFLVFGPLFDFKLFWLYGLIFRRKFVIYMGLFMFALVGFVCWRLGPIIKRAPQPVPADPVDATPAPLPPPAAAVAAPFSRLAIAFV